MSMGNRQQKGNQNQQTVVSNEERIHPVTKVVLQLVQVLQSFAILVLSWLVTKGSDNWLGNVMPGAGILVTITLCFLVVVFLWVQRIQVMKTDK